MRPLFISENGKVLACNAGVFWRARLRVWSSERHLGFKLGRGLERDKNASQGVGVRLSPPPPHLLCPSQYGGELTTASSKTKTPALQARKVLVSLLVLNVQSEKINRRPTLSEQGKYFYTKLNAKAEFLMEYSGDFRHEESFSRITNYLFHYFDATDWVNTREMGRRDWG